MTDPKDLGPWTVLLQVCSTVREEIFTSFTRNRALGKKKKKKISVSHQDNSKCTVKHVHLICGPQWKGQTLEKESS